MTIQAADGFWLAGRYVAESAQQLSLELRELPVKSLALPNWSQVDVGLFRFTDRFGSPVCAGNSGFVAINSVDGYDLF